MAVLNNQRLRRSEQPGICAVKSPLPRRSWQAGLQLEVAKRIVTAAQRKELGCRSYRRASWEAAQSRSSPDKWLLREEVAERRGASAKGLLSEEVVQQRKAALIPPSIHPSFSSFIRSVTGSLIHWFNDWFTDSIIHWFIDFVDSLIHWLIGSLILSVSCAWILSCHFIGTPITII